MKIIKEVSEEEMRNNFPELFEALDNPDEAMYCNNCDGLRVFENGRCKVCGKC